MAINSKLLKKSFLLERIHSLSRKRAAKIANDIEKYLKPGNKILDVGAGNCNICEALMKNNFIVTAIDIKNLSLVKNINPIICNGEDLLFNDNEFDVALLLFVLHHCNNPEKVLSEASRVSRRLIVMEDIYSNIFQKYLTFAIDSFLNQEFIGHPHSNKSDFEWKKLFENLGLLLENSEYKSRFLLKHVSYNLKKVQIINKHKTKLCPTKNK